MSFSSCGSFVSTATRMTLLKGYTYGLSLYHRKKWDPLPFEGTLTELVDVMNTALAHWATDWSLPDP